MKKFLNKIANYCANQIFEKPHWGYEFTLSQKLLSIGVIGCVKVFAIGLICSYVCVSCGFSNSGSELTDTVKVEESKEYIVKIVKTYHDTVPDIYEEPVDVIVNDTIKHKTILKLRARVCGLGVEYKYCDVSEINGNDTVWNRAMICSISEHDFNRAYRLYKTEDQYGSPYLKVNEGDGIDELLCVSEKYRKHLSDDIFYFGNEIDSANVKIDLSIKDDWKRARKIVKEHNAKQ